MILPFVFWSLVYISRSIILRFQAGENMSLVDIAREFFVQLRDGSSLHLWYIYMIIGLYLFIPIIGKWVRNATEKEIRYFLIIWLCTLFLDQPIISKIKPEIDLSYFTGFLGYLILGYYLRIKTFETRRKLKLTALAMLFAGLLSTIVGTYLILYYKNEYGSTFYECLSPNIFLYATGLFLLFKNKDTNSRFIVPVRNFICKYSYGIFLVHVLVLYLLDDIGVTWDFINPIAGIPVTVFLCLIISSGIIYIVNKLPFGKYISG